MFDLLYHALSYDFMFCHICSYCAILFHAWSYLVILWVVILRVLIIPDQTVIIDHTWSYFVMLYHTRSNLIISARALFYLIIVYRTDRTWSHSYHTCSYLVILYYVFIPYQSLSYMIVLFHNIHDPTLAYLIVLDHTSSCLIMFNHICSYFIVSEIILNHARSQFTVLFIPCPTYFITVHHCYFLFTDTWLHRIVVSCDNRGPKSMRTFRPSAIQMLETDGNLSNVSWLKRWRSLISMLCYWHGCTWTSEVDTWLSDEQREERVWNSTLTEVTGSFLRSCLRGNFLRPLCLWHWHPCFSLGTRSRRSFESPKQQSHSPKLGSNFARQEFKRVIQHFSRRHATATVHAVLGTTAVTSSWYSTERLEQW